MKREGSTVSSVSKTSSQKNSEYAAALRKAYPLGDEYDLEKEIGRGSYGSVARAKHLPSGRTVAIKKVANVFANIIDAKRLLREVAILRQLPLHKNVVRLYDVFEPTVNP